MKDEATHPRLGQYEHDHTKQWSAQVAAADAVVFVMPEYNYSFSAPLKNAFDYLHNEWKYKPVGFVSYGGVFEPDAGAEGAAKTMLDELARLAPALATLR